MFPFRKWCKRLRPGFLFGPQCCDCSGCTITLCISCNASPHVVGATVVAKSGSTTVATGTTNSSGCVTLDVGTAGTYTFLVTGGTPACGSDPYHIKLAVTCGNTYDINCCGCGGGSLDCQILPATIFVTDDAGTTPCFNDGANLWIGCTTIPVGNVVGFCDCGDFTTPCGATGGDIPVRYTIDLEETVGNPMGCNMGIVRGWTCCEMESAWCYYTCPTPPTSPTCTSPDNQCGPGTDSCPDAFAGSGEDDLVGYAQYSCVIFPVTLTMNLGNCGTSTALPSPFGSGITIDI